MKFCSPLILALILQLLLSLPAPELLAKGAPDGQRISVTGTLEVLQSDDFERGISKMIYNLKESSTGKIRQLRFAKEPKQKLKSGMWITVNGAAEGASIDIIGEAQIESPDVAQGVIDNGVRNAIVLITDFENESVLHSVEDMAATMFTGTTNVAGYYHHMSNGSLSFPADTDLDNAHAPDVFRVTLEAQDPPAVCNNIVYYGWRDDANQAAEALGIDMDAYQHRIYILPYETTRPCGWAGLASVGCNPPFPCSVWIRTPQHNDVWAHELGHNLGMAHAALDTDNDGISDNNYGDKSDIMGYAGVGWRQFNAPRKEIMGWTDLEKITEASASNATYSLSPLEQDAELALHPQILKIYAPDRDDHYYLSYRQRLGPYDQGLLNEYVDGLSIHRREPSSYAKTFLLDVLVDSVDSVDSGVFIDFINHFAIRQISHNTTSVNVGIEYSTCGANGVEIAEKCEGTDLDGESCTSLGFPSGALACDDNCLFDLSGCVPIAPTNLSASALSETEIDLYWADNTPNENGYSIERRLNNTSFAEIATVETDVKQFSDTGLMPATTYTYRVRAFNAAGYSAYTEEVSAQTEGGDTVPPQPVINMWVGN